GRVPQELRTRYRTNLLFWANKRNYPGTPTLTRHRKQNGSETQKKNDKDSNTHDIRELLRRSQKTAWDKMAAGEEDYSYSSDNFSIDPREGATCVLLPTSKPQRTPTEEPVTASVLKSMLAL
ncbi:Hypothetical predicted protein, partial [Pelobates cultripes]